MARQVLENGVILPAEYSDDWYDDMTSNLTKLDDVIGSDSEKLSSADVGAAALSNSYNDLDNLPTIPTKTSDLTNDSNFVDTSNSAVSSGITSAKVTSYDSHISDTDIHVTTADKNKWNNQTYVFRYSSTALVASSTNSNALLDNTDNLKVGDKVIDSSGVLFSITAIDAVNSTFTIGTALIDLALDSSVMHLLGNETSNGIKTFNNVVPISGAYLGNEPSTSFRTVLLLRSLYDTAGKSGWFVSKFRSNSAQGALSGSDSVFLTFDVLENEVRTNGILRFNLSGWSGNTPGAFSLYPKTGITTNLGITSSKWTKINGVEPSSLGMPDLSNGIDISSYLTAGNSNNTYTPSANGWISISLGRASSAIAIFIEQGDMKVNSYCETGKYQDTDVSCFACLPVVAGVEVNIGLKGSGNYINSAKFFPCQGNV